jgi:hypothetical protein
MPLLDLSTVTTALMELLRRNVRLIDPAMSAVAVTPEPPETVRGVMNTLSLHLYHASEDPHYRNRVGPGSDAPNVAKAPLSLVLHYILNAHHATSSETQDALGQQKLFGYALKTLHDFPVITDATALPIDSTSPPTPVLPAALHGRENHLRVQLVAVKPEDAMSFWASGADRTTRLSAYYDVRVVMLEPERPRRMPGVVLSVGTSVVGMRGPALERSENAVRFTLPASAGGATQVVTSTPARVPLSTDPFGPTVARFTLRGTGLAGTSPALLIRHAAWARAGLPERVEVDAAWSPVFAPDRVQADLQPQIIAGAHTLPVLPGHYTAAVRVVIGHHERLGARQPIVALSNEVAFAVAPHVTGQGFADVAANEIRVFLAPTFDLRAAELDEAVELVVDGEVLPRVAELDDTGAPAFAVTGANELTVRPPFSLAAAGEHPLRVVVRGVESQPFWLEVVA